MKIEQPFHTFRVVHHHSRFSYFSAQWFYLDSLGVKVVLKNQYNALFYPGSPSRAERLLVNHIKISRNISSLCTIVDVFLSYIVTWGIFSQFISPHFCAVSPLSMFFINQPLISTKN